MKDTINTRGSYNATGSNLFRHIEEVEVMDYELSKLRAQVAVLKDIERDYPSSSIDNCISQIEARIKQIEITNK